MTSDTRVSANQNLRGKEAVLSSAISNFYALGFHGTSMRDIAKGSGMTVASIYHHFSSKQEILHEIMITVMSDLMSSTRSALMAADSSPHAQLRALVNSWILFHATRQADAFVASTEIRSLNPNWLSHFATSKNICSVMSLQVAFKTAPSRPCTQPKRRGRF